MTSPASNIDSHLPPELRGATISKIAQGLSGAGVYRVEKDGHAYVLKFSTAAALARVVGEAGVAPRVIHSDAETVLTELVENQQFFSLMMRSPVQAVDQLGQLLARVHALPVMPGMEKKSASQFLDGLDHKLVGFALPAWFADAVAAARALPVPDPGPRVLSHNDVNPSNLIFDGERVMLLDWDVAGLNSRYYDLAAAALFFRFDEAMCLRLLSAHEGSEVTALPERFVYDRYLVGAMVGSIFMTLAREGGHPGDASAEPPQLVELYGRMRAGTLDPATSDGQFLLGLALVAQSRGKSR